MKICVIGHSLYMTLICFRYYAVNTHEPANDIWNIFTIITFFTFARLFKGDDWFFEKLIKRFAFIILNFNVTKLIRVTSKFYFKIRFSRKWELARFAFLNCIC